MAKKTAFDGMTDQEVFEEFVRRFDVHASVLVYYKDDEYEGVKIPMVRGFMHATFPGARQWAKKVIIQCKGIRDTLGNVSITDLTGKIK